MYRSRYIFLGMGIQGIITFGMDQGGVRNDVDAVVLVLKF